MGRYLKKSSKDYFLIYHFRMWGGSLTTSNRDISWYMKFGYLDLKTNRVLWYVKIRHTMKITDIYISQKWLWIVLQITKTNDRIKYRKKGLLRTNLSFFVKFKRHKIKDRSESYVHILMLVRATKLRYNWEINSKDLQDFYPKYQKIFQFESRGLFRTLQFFH
jgi:hypothetical protein